MLSDTEESEVETMAASPRCTPEFKQRAVELYLSLDDPTCAEVGRKLGVDAGSIAAWVKAAAVSGDNPQADANPFQMAEDLKRLKRENAQLKRENETLLKPAPSSRASSCKCRGEEGAIRLHVGSGRLRYALRPQGRQAGLLCMEEPLDERV